MKNIVNRSLAKVFGIYLEITGKINTAFWRLFLKAVGKDTVIGRNFGPGHPEKITIGDCSVIGDNCQIIADSGVMIGRYVLIAKNCQLISSNHEFSDDSKPIMCQGMRVYKKPIVIEDDVWIGNNVTILPQVTIGRGSVIGVGSVVTKDVPPYSIVAGVPAKFIRWRIPKNKWKKR